ncbi:PTS fructose transporter subunit IIA [Clostridium sp. DMHC 10]|uniref:PTS sugar transporter subunit IIA n=1 Tax=Clostridium sp. DMHC 10 TaxID=747377 RepID=UPI00069ED6AF|nr:PTS fructose transporter subunit IIA [Clostridium sp. DMHC 10]KOF55795.1 PTS fructose transporter subunit IIA [Clostridium sp. DMHC 10]
MTYIILASHGGLAKGMKDTLSMIIGDVSMIEAFSSYRDEHTTIKSEVEKTIKEKYNQNNIFILTDIFGGSVNTAMISLLEDYPKLHILSGMNLSLVISLTTQTDEISEESLKQIIYESKQSIIDCNQLLKQYKQTSPAKKCQ